jgi:hypothetical protein
LSLGKNSRHYQLKAKKEEERKGKKEKERKKRNLLSENSV